MTFLVKPGREVLSYISYMTVNHPSQVTGESQINDSIPTAEEPQEEHQEDYDEDDDPDLALAMKMSLESYQEEESMKTEERPEERPEEVEEECDTDNESRRVRYDTMATVIEVGDDGEYRIDFTDL